MTTDPAFEIWQVKLESLLTRIDAGFAEETRPQTLSVLRSGLLASVERERGGVAQESPE